MQRVKLTSVEECKAAIRQQIAAKAGIGATVKKEEPDEELPKGQLTLDSMESLQKVTCCMRPLESGR